MLYFCSCGAGREVGWMCGWMWKSSRRAAEELKVSTLLTPGLLCKVQAVNQPARGEVWACGWPCGQALTAAAAASAAEAEVAGRRWGSIRALASAHLSPFPPGRVVQGALQLAGCRDRSGASTEPQRGTATRAAEAGTVGCRGSLPCCWRVCCTPSSFAGALSPACIFPLPAVLSLRFSCSSALCYLQLSL